MEKIINNELPLVSIVIPVYNGANYIAEAIDSALNQDYPNVEVIVVNDGSTDNGETDRICKSYKNRIQYYKKENGGVSSALNLGISKMNGEYFSWLSHDDKYEYSKISKSINLIINDRNNMSIALCGTKHINAHGEPLTFNRGTTSKQNKYSGYELFKRCLIDQKSINGSGLLIPKKAFETCGSFSDLRFAQDLECWCRMMIEGYQFITTPEELSITRIHKLQGTNTMRQVYLDELSKFYDLIYNYCLIVPDNKRREDFLKLLLIACYSKYGFTKSTINKIEKQVKLSWTRKVFEKYKGYLINTLKNYYHKIKYCN